MSPLEHLLTIPCELIRRVYDVDPDGDGGQTRTEVVEATTCEVQTAGSREDESGSVQIATYRVFLGAEVPLRGWDAIRLVDTGEVLELEGDAFAPRSPLTGDSHVEAVARRTDYGAPPPPDPTPAPLELEGAV